MSIVASGPGAGLISWTPTQAQAPVQGVIVTVTDSGGLYDKQAVVIGVNGSPSFVNAVTAPTTARVGSNMPSHRPRQIRTQGIVKPGL